MLQGPDVGVTSDNYYRVTSMEQHLERHRMAEKNKNPAQSEDGYYMENGCFLLE